MNNNRSNYKLIIRIHQIVGVMLLSSVFLLPEESRKTLLTALGTVVISMFIQVFLYGVYPNSFKDKIEKHLDES